MILKPPPIRSKFPVPIGPLMQWRNNQTRREYCKASLFNTFCFFWPTFGAGPLRLNWHVPYLCNELQKPLLRAVHRQPCLYDLIVNIPPATTKSSVASICSPLYAWMHDPTFVTLSACNTHILFKWFANKTRQVMNSERWKDLFPDIFLVSEAMEDMMTGQNGHRVGTSAGANFIGLHFRYHVIDDPLSPPQAQSEVERNNINFWIEQTIRERAEDKNTLFTALIHQRLSVDDPTPRRLAKASSNPVKHICLPAEIVPDTTVKPVGLRRYYVNDGFSFKLDPVRLSEKVLKQRRAEPHYGGQYLQNPLAAGGGMFRIGEIQVFSAPPKIVRSARGWDRSYTDAAGDFTAGAKVGLDDQGRFWILDLRRGQWGGYERDQQMKQAAQLDGKSNWIIIEGESGPGKELAENTAKTVLKGFPRVKIVSPRDPKFKRAEEFAKEVNIGNVYMVRALWNQTVLDELASFPTPGLHDDIVDALSYAVTLLLKPPLMLGVIE